MRRVAALSLSVLLLAACGGGSAEAPPADAEPQVEPGTALFGRVGTVDDPDAYEISLTTADGTPVEVLAAGTYTLEVVDPTRIHNWHLTGAGVEDVSTGVADLEEEVFEVTFEPGTYEYVCDPHPSMVGVVRVV